MVNSPGDLEPQHVKIASKIDRPEKTTSMNHPMTMNDTIWTIGHSNHPIDTFLGLLQQANMTQVADVRRFPGSKRHPHFGQDALNAALQDQGIGYRHFPELGGRRGRRAPDSPNNAWRVDAFNAYADHMRTSEFQDAMAALLDWSRSGPTAIMCSEALPWRCHRRLIADALIIRGWTVWNILGDGRREPQPMTPFARVVGGQLIYPTNPLFFEEK